MFRNCVHRWRAAAIVPIVDAWRMRFDDGTAPDPANAADVAAFHRGRQTPCPQA